MSGRLLVIGEALVDIVAEPSGERTEHVGGSPANVAMGLARLGHDVDFACSLGRDERGARIADHLADHGVHVLPVSFGADPTSTAVATLDEGGAASYEFDLHWNLPAVDLPEGTGHVHTGSIGTVLQPGAASVDRRARGGPGQPARCPTTPTSAPASWATSTPCAPGSRSWSPSATWSRPARTTSSCCMPASHPSR